MVPCRPAERLRPISRAKPATWAAISTGAEDG
jgi:hypothetical protein